MYWVKEMQNTIAFIEGRITEDISIEKSPAVLTHQVPILKESSVLSQV